MNPNNAAAHFQRLGRDALIMFGVVIVLLMAFNAVVKTSQKAVLDKITVTTPNR